jgi:hypothetical protein
MRADIHDGREHTLQSQAGYIDARPHRQDRRNLLHRTAGPYIGVKTGKSRNEQMFSGLPPQSRKAHGCDFEAAWQVGGPPNSWQCCAPAIAFAAGDNIEDETHVHILANEPLLDAAAQTTQAQRHDGRQLWMDSDIAFRRVERDLYLKVYRRTVGHGDQLITFLLEPHSRPRQHGRG